MLTDRLGHELREAPHAGVQTRRGGNRVAGYRRKPRLPGRPRGGRAGQRSRGARVPTRPCARTGRAWRRHSPCQAVQAPQAQRERDQERRHRERRERDAQQLEAELQAQRLLLAHQRLQASPDAGKSRRARVAQTEMQLAFSADLMNFAQHVRS